MVSRILMAIVFFVSQITFANNEVLTQQFSAAPIYQGRMIYVEFQGQVNVKGPIRLRVKDLDLGSTAIIQLNPQPKHPSTWYGYFVIQFRQGDQTQKKLEFTDAKGKMLYTYAAPSGETQQLNIFSKKNEWKKYLEQVSPEFIEAAKIRQQELEQIKAEQELTKNMKVKEKAEKLAQLKAEREKRKAELEEKKAQELALKEEIKEKERLRKAEEKAQQEEEKRQKELARLTAIEIAKKQAELRQIEKDQELARIKMEQDLVMAREEKIREQQALSAKAKQKIQDKANALASEGMRLYKLGKYDEAEKKFIQASETDPTNDQFYYQYGVTLYKNNKFNKSLATLSMAESGDFNPVERDYYIALNHMKLKEFDKAYKGFVEVKSENNPDISPVAAFFAGNIDYQNQNLSEARGHFEYVIDNSNDPQLDKEAELMIEEIDKIENFLASDQEILNYSFTFGFSYDENILNVAQSNVSTSLTGYRFNYGAQANYHLYKGYQKQLSLGLGLNDYYSLNKSFSPDATLQAADPLELSITLPYKQQLNAFKQVYNLDITPLYKNLIMNPDGTSRRNILTTTGISTQLSYNVSSAWLSSYKIDFASDSSKITATSTDDDSSATKVTIGTTQTKLLDEKGTYSLAGDISILQNQAVGKNNRYQKLGLGLTYVFPFKLESIGSLKLDTASQRYSQATNPRTDQLTNLTASAMKDIAKDFNLNLSFQYTISSSPLDASNYNKFLLSSVLTYSGKLLESK